MSVYHEKCFTNYVEKVKIWNVQKKDNERAQNRQ